MGARYKTFDATGIAPGGRLFAGDLNAIQDMKADSVDFSQTIDLNTLRVGDASIQFLKYGSGEARLTAALRTDGILRGLGGLLAGAFTTTQRNAIPVNGAPYGIVILNTDTNQYEWNVGTDGARVWKAIGPRITYGTSFPTSPAPVTGDEHVLVDNVTNPTYQWRFRYNAGSAWADKWEYVGGTRAMVQVDTQQNMTASGLYHDVSTVGPSFTLPVAGVFDIEFGVRGSSQQAGQYNSSADISIWNAGTAQVSTHFLHAAGQGDFDTMATAERITGQPASRELRMRYKNVIAGGTAGYVADRWLAVEPVRCS